MRVKILEKEKFQRGYSMIEVLIVIFVFSILAILSAQSVALVLRSNTKSETSVIVKQNLDYAASVMERKLRGAEDLTCTGTYKLGYTVEVGTLENFECIGNRINSTELGGFLTSAEVNINCNVFVCEADGSSVSITLAGEESNFQGELGSTVIIETRVFSRDY